MSDFTPSGLPKAAVNDAVQAAIDGIEDALAPFGFAQGEASLDNLLILVARPIGDGSIDVQMFGSGDPDAAFAVSGIDIDATVAYSLLKHAKQRADARGCRLSALYADALAVLDHGAMPKARPQ